MLFYFFNSTEKDFSQLAKNLIIFNQNLRRSTRTIWIGSRGQKNTRSRVRICNTGWSTSQFLHNMSWTEHHNKVVFYVAFKWKQLFNCLYEIKWWYSISFLCLLWCQSLMRWIFSLFKCGKDRCVNPYVMWMWKWKYYILCCKLYVYYC